MVDAIKMAAKIAVVAVATGLVIAVFTGITLPEVNVVKFAEALSKGYAVVNYYAGWLMPLLNLGVLMLALRYVALPTFYLGIIAIKWILKVNE